MATLVRGGTDDLWRFAMIGENRAAQDPARNLSGSMYRRFLETVAAANPHPSTP